METLLLGDLEVTESYVLNTGGAGVHTNPAATVVVSINIPFGGRAVLANLGSAIITLHMLSVCAFFASAVHALINIIELILIRKRFVGVPYRFAYLERSKRVTIIARSTSSFVAAFWAVPCTALMTTAQIRVISITITPSTITHFARPRFCVTAWANVVLTKLILIGKRFISVPHVFR
jgi:hypothetical protein